jgi:hypothetical protein
MLAARVEPKNGPQENKKTGNFKPLVLSQFQAAVDSRKTSIAGMQISNWMLVIMAVVVIWIIYKFIAH